MKKFKLSAVYVNPLTDFVLFDEEKDDSEYYLEQVYLTRNRTKTLFTDKLNLIFVELPKFTKEKIDLRTGSDFWFYSLKHAEELAFRPAEIQGEIFDKLFETLEINQLTEKEMETYNKSILKYRDVRSAVEFAEEKYYEKGMKQGVKKGIEIAAIKLLREGMSIDFVSRTMEIPPEQLIDLM